MNNSSGSSWIYKTVSYNQCPKCKMGLLDTRVSRGPIVKHLFFWLQVKRYRCNNCAAKVYVKNENVVDGAKPKSKPD
jgi:DNA-directed RNA polymerase subunit RPC12/RpoP